MNGTGNEIAVRTPDAVMTPARSFQAAADLDSWIGIVNDIAAFAEQVCRTSFVPKAYRNDPAATCAAILTGRELGLPPMTALRHVQLVEGSASLSAEYKRARVLAAGHRLDITERTTEACTVTGHRKGHEPVTVRYTMKDARTAGLVKDRGAWMTRPRRMLFARACTEVCDALFTDLTNGLPTAELLEDGDGEEMPGYAEHAPSAPRATAADIRAQAAARTAAAEVVQPASRERVNEIWGHLDRLGHKPDREWRLRVISSILSRDVAGSGDLTEDDAARVIADLEGRQPGDLAHAGDHQADVRAEALGHFERLGIAGHETRMNYAGALLEIAPPASLDSLARAEALRLRERLAACAGKDALDALLATGEVPGGE